MNRLVVGFLAVLLTGGVAHAQATTALRYAQITGTASAPTAGACTGHGYADQCPSTNCSCVAIASATVGPVPVTSCTNPTGCFNFAGKGTANLFLTFDDGLVMPSTSTTEPPECTPFFGVANLTTTRHHSPTVETLNLTGVSCVPPVSGAKTVLGGFGILAGATNGGTGFGKIRGLYVGPAAGPVSLTVFGPITQ